MDYWSFIIKIYSELDGNYYMERGILIADDEVEAINKLKLFYKDDVIKEITVTWETNQGIYLFDKVEEESNFEDMMAEIMDGRTYTIKADNVC